MNENLLFLWKGMEDANKIWHTFISHDNSSKQTKNSTFFEKNWGMMLKLSNAPLRELN